MIDKQKQEKQELIINIPVKFRKNFSPTQSVGVSVDYILSQSAEKIKAAITRYIEWQQENLFKRRGYVCSVTATEVRYLDENNILRKYNTTEIAFLETLRDYGKFKNYGKKEYSYILHAMAFWGEMDEKYYEIYHLLINELNYKESCEELLQLSYFLYKSRYYLF